MNTQIYAYLLKDSDPDKEWFTTQFPKLAAGAVKNVILGDSVDVPFVKAIRVTGFQNSIGYTSGTVRVFDDSKDATEPKSQSYGHGAGEYDDADFGVAHPAQSNESEGKLAWWRPQRGDKKRGVRTKTRTTLKSRYARGVEKATREETFTRPFKSAPRGAGAYGNYGASQHTTNFFSTFKKSDFLNPKLPDHNDIEFTKLTDNATPQLAYACSSKERIKGAVFFFRRKIGMGVRGVRVPYMFVILKKCLVSGWDLNGDTETVTLQYNEIQWCTYDHVSDWNAATGMSNRKWDKDDGGGESIAGYVLMGLIAGVAMGAALGADVASSATGSSAASIGSSSSDLSRIE